MSRSLMLRRSPSWNPRRRRYRPELEILEDRTVPTVFNIANGDVPGLIAAINTANTNAQADTINLAAGGMYQFSAAAAGTGGLVATPFIPLDGSAANSITINGNGATLQNTGNSYRMFWITSGVLLANNLTIANASIPPSCCGGAGMVVGTAGTAPANSTGTVNLANVTFTGNIANNAGGAMYMYGPNSTATLTNCTITGNKVMNGGAAGGGGLVVAGAGDTLTISGSTISNNTSAGPAGGIRVNNNNITVNISNSTISGNTAANAGGGGLYVSGTGNTITITSSSLTSNSAKYAGAINVAGTGNTITVTSSTLSTNSASGNSTGGAFGIVGTNNAVNLVSSTLSGNTATANVSGGSAFMQGTTLTLNITNSTITGNTGGYSGGIYCKPGGATVNITGSTIDTNTANDAYGPAVGMNSGTLTVTNSTLSGNTANKGTSGNSGKGGALWIYKSTVNLRDTTITGNKASNAANGVGGGIYRFGAGGTMTITNSIIAGNIAPVSAPDFKDTPGTAAVTFSLLSSAQGNTVVNGTNNNIISASPGLGVLQYNGGPSTGAPTSLTPLRTVSMLSGSPAIDTGSNGAVPPAVTTDERGAGFARIINGTVDMGAYEFQPPATTTTVSSSANPSGLGQSITFTATVTVNAPGSNAIQGSVTFLDNGTALATVPLSGGSAVFTTAALTAGSHTITAQYSGFAQGDFSFSASTASLSETVTSNPTTTTLTSSINPSSTGAPVTFTATVNAAVPPGLSLSGTVSFFDNGSLLGMATLTGSTATFTTAGLTTGRHTITAVYSGNANFPTSTGTLVQTVSAGIYAIGADAGGSPLVYVYNRNNQAVISFNAFPLAFTGGVRVAVGDVNGDGIPDIVAVAGPGGGPEVNIYDGRNYQLAAAFYALPSTFTGGLFVATGDLTGSGHADIIIGADKGGLDEVLVFNGITQAPVTAFFPFGQFATGGVRVAAGDITGAGHADIVLGAGAGSPPQVSIFDGITLNVLGGFNAYAVSFTGGVYVAVGDLTGAGHAEVITGAGSGGGPQVNVFDGITGALLSAFNAAPRTFTGGVRVAARDLFSTGRSELIAGAGPGGLSQTSVLGGLPLNVLTAFFAYGPFFHGGEFVG